MTDDDQLHLEKHLSATGLRSQARADNLNQDSPAQETDNSEELVCFFQEARASLQSMREYFIAGKRSEIQKEASRIERKASNLSAKGVCLKARALRSQTLSGIRTVHIDALEQQLDASEAIYHSCRLRV